VAGKAPVCLPPLGFHVSQITPREEEENSVGSHWGSDWFDMRQQILLKEVLLKGKEVDHGRKESWQMRPSGVQLPGGER
jgi:hypothetical protein